MDLFSGTGFKEMFGTFRYGTIQTELITLIIQKPMRMNSK